ncbi:pickpocket protein 28-like [Culicoides brevitarsis]|uniref:pickpocket protein 28-like n=1 Tax=Culicoides brevitarsis TaxID=469753 RepID=UPI00307B2F3A
MLQMKHLPYGIFKAKGFPSKDWSFEDGYDNNYDTDVYPLRGASFNKQVDLRLRLKMNRNDFNNSESLTVISNNMLYTIQKFHGFWVYVHHPMNYPHNDETKTFIPLNSRMTLNVEPDKISAERELNHYPFESRNCFIKEKELTNSTIFKHYTEENCLLECRAVFSESKCDCVPFFIPYRNCFPPCSSLTYNVRETMTGALPISNNSFRYSEVIVKLNLFEFLGKRRQESYSILDILSAFGGLLGFFVGASVMSIMELIFFFTVKIGIDLFTKIH